MFIFDIFRQEARRLRTASLVIGGGMLLLLAGLWYVQIVSGPTMQRRLVTQSFRKPSVPAERGRIFDCNSNALVENRAQYNVVLYLEELRGQFNDEFNRLAKEYPHTGKLSVKVANAIRLQANYRVASNITFQTAAQLKQPATLSWDRFTNFYANYTFLPLPIILNLSPTSVAIFSEQCSGQPWLDLDRQPVLSYPQKSTAAHLLGYVVRSGDHRNYTTLGYTPESGIEAAFDDDLKGEPGTNLVLVDNQGYRQHQDNLVPNQAGKDIYLTISLPVQKIAEHALTNRLGRNVRGAAVVMDVNTGDVLAMASSPTFDPNAFVNGITQAEWEQLNDPKLRTLDDKATFPSYPPGSTFKIITSIACLESGVMNPRDIFHLPPNPADTNRGIFYYGKGASIKDTAPPGDYEFESAFYHSSNGYFAYFGLKAGLRKLLEVASRFHLGEKAQIASRQEAAGFVPKPDEIPKDMQAPEVAIGQEIEVTPLQMTVMVAAIANGGTLFWPRLVSEIRASETGAVERTFPARRVRDHVTLRPEDLALVRHAMLCDTEVNGVPSNAYAAFHPARHTLLQDNNFKVAGKTGTAQVRSAALDYNHVTWFDSYGPYDSPRYAVVVMVLDGSSGGGTCAPVAAEIYEGLVKMEKSAEAKKASTRS